MRLLRLREKVGLRHRAVESDQDHLSKGLGARLAKSHYEVSKGTSRSNATVTVAGLVPKLGTRSVVTILNVVFCITSSQFYCVLFLFHLSGLRPTEEQFTSFTSRETK